MQVEYRNIKIENLRVNDRVVRGDKANPVISRVTKVTSPTPGTVRVYTTEDAFEATRNSKVAMVVNSRKVSISAR